MLEKIIILAVVVLAGAYLVRRFLRKGGCACGCGCPDDGSSGCCGGQRDIKPIGECGCSKKS